MLDPTGLRAAYQRDGYVIVRGLLAPAVVAAAAEHTERAIVGAAEGAPTSRRMQTTWGSGDEVKMAKVSGLVGTDRVFSALGSRDELVDVIEALLGPGARRFRDVLIIKPPRSSGEFSYHQDSAYWDVEPKALVSAWIALGDVPEEASCLRVIPRSHLVEHEHGIFVAGRRVPSPIVRLLRALVSRAGTGDAPGAAGGSLPLWRLKSAVLTAATRRLPVLAQLGDYQVDPRTIDRSQEQALPVAAGDVIFFHSLLLHRSDRNQSERPRYASIVSFMSREARFVGKGESHFPPARGGG